MSVSRMDMDRNLLTLRIRDFGEAVAAFFAERKPKFTGR